MFNQYIFILIWIGLCAVFIYGAKLKRTELVYGESVERVSWWLAFIVFVPVIWMAGHRGHIGDSDVYAASFQAMPDTFSEIPAYVSTLTKDAGYYTFAAILKQFIGNNTVLYFTVMALIQGVILLSVYRKYSYNYVLSIFLFIASSDYISWMFNGIRQFTAVTIIFAATAWMLNKRYILTILVILFAALFHQSALIMLPIVLICQGDAWNKKTMAFIVAALLAVLFVGKFTNFLDDALSGTQYTDVVSDYTSWNDDGTNPFRVAVYCVPAVLAFIDRQHIRDSRNVLVNFCTNMSIVSAGIYLISMVTSGIFLGRLPIYCSLYGYILIPWEMDHMFSRNVRPLVYGVMIVLYLLFYYYQMHLTFSLL